MAKNTTKAKTEPAVEEDQGMTTPQSAAADSSPDKGSLDTEGKVFSGTHVVNTARGLNLRQRPSFGAAVLEVLPFGTAVQDIDPAGAPAGWLHVMTEDGKAGFVAARYVSPIKE